MTKSTDLKHFLKGSLINAGRFLARFWGLNHVVVSRIKRTYVDFVCFKKVVSPVRILLFFRIFKTSVSSADFIFLSIYRWLFFIAPANICSGAGPEDFVFAKFCKNFEFFFKNLKKFDKNLRR